MIPCFNLLEVIPENDEECSPADSIYKPEEIDPKDIPLVYGTQKERGTQTQEVKLNCFQFRSSDSATVKSHVSINRDQVNELMNMMTYMQEGQLSCGSQDSNQQEIIKQIQKLYYQMKAAKMNKACSSGKRGAVHYQIGS